MSDNWVVQNLENALATWNEKLAEIWQLITQSPETFKGGIVRGVCRLRKAGINALCQRDAHSLVAHDAAGVKNGMSPVRCDGSQCQRTKRFPDKVQHIRADKFLISGLAEQFIGKILKSGKIAAASVHVDMCFGNFSFIPRSRFFHRLSARKRKAEPDTDAVNSLSRIDVVRAADQFHTETVRLRCNKKDFRGSAGYVKRIKRSMQQFSFPAACINGGTNMTALMGKMKQFAWKRRGIGGRGGFAGKETRHIGILRVTWRYRNADGTNPHPLGVFA